MSEPSELVKRIAKAIWDERQIRICLEKYNSEEEPTAWDEASPELKSIYYSMAQIAKDITLGRK